MGNKSTHEPFRRFPEPDKNIVFSRLSNKKRVFDSILKSIDNDEQSSVNTRKKSDADSSWSVLSYLVVYNPEEWCNQREREDYIIKTVTCNPQVGNINQGIRFVI